MRAALPVRCLLFAAVALQAPGASAVGDPERPPPDTGAIEEVLRGSGQPEGRYVSARAVEHYLRARLALEDGILERAEEELALASVYDPQSAWPRYAMALDHLRHGETLEAEKDLRVALQVEPRHAPSLRLRARLLLEQGKTSQAIAALNDATQIEPRDPEPVALLVRAYLWQGQLTQASSAARRLDTLVTRLQDGERMPVGQALSLAARSHQLLAEALEAQGRFPEAEAWLRRSLDRQPGSVTRVDALVKFLEARGRYADAARLAATSLALTGPRPSRLLRVARLHLDAGAPKAAAAYVRLATGSEDEAQDLEALVSTGASLMAADEAQVALEAFEAVLVRAPERDDVRWYAALASEQLGRYGQALDLYRSVTPGSALVTHATARAAYCEHRLGRSETALQTLVALTNETPDDEELLLVLARVREELGDAARGIAQVEHLIQRRPTRRLLLELAALYRRQQRAPEAVELLTLERHAAPGDDAVAWSLAQALAAAGRSGRALAEAKALLGRHPTRADVANLIARVLAEDGTALDDAHRYAQLALELQPERWEYLDTLGWTQLKSGKLPQAVETLTQAHALAPDDLEVALHLAEALAATGHAQSSMSLLEKLTARTRAPALAVTHERAARLLESLTAAASPTAAATIAPVVP